MSVFILGLLALVVFVFGFTFLLTGIFHRKFGVTLIGLIILVGGGYFIALDAELISLSTPLLLL